jgi:hypothetical protein
MSLTARAFDAVAMTTFRRSPGIPALIRTVPLTVRDAPGASVPTRQTAFPRTRRDGTTLA